MKSKLLHPLWLLVVWGAVAALGAAEEPKRDWPGVQFAEVRAFAWPADLMTEKVVSDALELKSGGIDPAGRRLSAAQVERLLRSVRRRPLGKRIAVSGCYWPRNAFVFYDGAGRATAAFEICFDCHGIFRLPATQGDIAPDFVELTKLFSELKLPFGTFESLAKAIARHREHDALLRKN